MLRWWHIVPLGLIGVVLLAKVSAPTSGVPSRPRNLLVITLDTLRADRLPLYGFQGFSTPAIDRIAAGGMVVEEAFASAPLTLPSHTSIFTGLHPPRHGVRDNASPPLHPQFTTLAEILRSHGLQTAGFVASVVVSPERGLDQGFDLYSSGDPARCEGAPSRRRAGEVVDEALSWLERHDAKPFFAWIHLFDTHRPYDLLDDYRNRHFDPYLAAIMYVDSEIARLIEHLDARKLLDSTLIIVVGDHGESLGGHGEESHGIFLYQEALRVPFIVSGPGVAPGRSRIARLIDVMPTVLDLFGLPVRGLDGISLARANSRSDGPSLEVYSESMYPNRYGWAPLRSLRAGRYKFIDAPRAELYDLTTDPMEEHNVIADHPTVAAAMVRRLRTIDREQKAPAGARVDRAVAEQLASLGYVAGIGPQGPADTSARQPDPKDHIDTYNRLTRLQWQDAHRRRSSCR